MVPPSRTRTDTVRILKNGCVVTAGAQLLVSPGSTRTILQAMTDTGLPHLPGVATVTEIMAALEAGLTELKFFPAEPAGGAPYLKSVSSPIPNARFCSTGGFATGTPRNTSRFPTWDALEAHGSRLRT